MGCGCCGTNPCQREPLTNTADCESLPSQIANFTAHFFGDITKTELDGEVLWTLPCNLEIGLTNNPRLESEGLACYFLRLFGEGIVGLTGPTGEAGSPGADGNNAYTVTVLSFTHPTEAAPNVQVKTFYNPAILEGLEVFIATSGWYFVNQVDTAGNLYLTLVQELTGAGGTITAGKLVVPTGPPGRSITGPTGPQGAQGEQGPAGESFTATNTEFYTAVGTDFETNVTYGAVNFTSGTAEVNLPNQGTYLVTAVVSILATATVGTSDVVSVKLRNTTNSVDIDGTEHTRSALVDTEQDQIVINKIITTDDNNRVITLFAKCTTAGAVDLVSDRTVITAVRIA